MDDVVPNALKHLRASDIIRMAGLAAASLGQEYCRLGAVQATMRRGALLLGVIDMSKWEHGTGAYPANRSIAAEDVQPEQQRYSVDIEIQSSNNWQAHCSCSPTSGVICRHVTALLYEWLARPETFTPSLQPGPQNKAVQRSLRANPRSLAMSRLCGVQRHPTIYRIS